MDTLERISNLLKSCMLPDLKQNLDSVPIEREHFKSYHQHLQIQLPLLYDWIQQKPKDFIWNGEISDTIKQEIQALLILVLCEISFPNSIFGINQPQLVGNAEKILQTNCVLVKEVEEQIYKYYEDKLHKDKWKKQLGAIHGFVKYLEFRFSYACDYNQFMDHKFLIFCLSVALNVRSCYETHYKSLSTTIFLTMMKQGVNDDIILMNIHSVIYDAVFKDIHIMDSVSFTIKQWNCLIDCLDFYEDFDSFTWNYLDDMMEVLLRNITLAPDSDMSICLLKIVKKLIVYFTINRKEFEKVFEKDLMQLEHINEYRLLAQTNTSYTCYRWAKSILKMFVLESHKLMQSIKNALDILQEVHKNYILAILPIKLSIIEPHLIIFLEKFIGVLMETVKVHKQHTDVMKALTSTLETFYIHLQKSEEHMKLFKFKKSIYNLLKTEAFKLYTSI